MTWHARLDLDYALREGRSIAHFRHEGPLRILQSLYPEDPAICHNVLVHPPGGLVGGDTIELQIEVGEGAHGLITTPGASRFYRSLGETARQHTRMVLAPNARLEWLPMEALCYSGCLADNHLDMALGEGAELMGWDVIALGLPQAGQPFTDGQFRQHLEMPGVWLERATLRASDERLMNGALALAGQRCIGNLFLLSGSPISRDRREHLLDLARQALEGHELGIRAGVTAPNDQVLLLRVLAPLVEPAMALLRQIWGIWRQGAWQIAGQSPRIWST